MSRTARQLSESGYYHIVLRGIGRQLLFEGAEEMQAFLTITKHYCDMFGVTIIAWCLMGNHVHLLVRSVDGVPSDVMKRIELSFAQRHNRSSDHVGHVFENRFKSKPVETDEQLLACVRYVHDNPSKADICKAPDYPWSSYHEYVGVAEIADTQVVLEMVGGVANFEEFSAGETGDYKGLEDRVRITDSEAREKMEAVLNKAERTALSHGTRATRDKAIGKLKAAGLSIRQIERLTGIGRSIIQRV